MGRLKANYNSSKNNKISIKKQNLGGGTLLLNYIFDPKEIQGLSLWLKADVGVTTEGGTPFISSVTLSDAGTAAVNGTYTWTGGAFYKVAGDFTHFISFDSEDGIWKALYNLAPLYAAGELAGPWFQYFASDDPPIATTSSTTPQVVTAWADQSGNGRNASSSIGTRPTFVSNTLNSKPVLRFDGAGQQMALTSSIGGTEYSIFIVCKNNDNTNGSMFFWSTDSNYGKYIASITSESYNASARNKFILSENDVGSGEGDSIIAWSSAEVNNNYFIGTATQNGGGKAYSNSSGGVDSVGTFDESNTFDLIGGYGFGYELDGDVAEIISYNRAVTSTERQQVETYLKGKYAITCGYQNINKLVQTAGNNAPIGATFDNIAFNYSSFASSCSSLGFDPATILNSLGGVDFSSNYVVIRAKTSSSISADSISDLGGGIINITSTGPSGGSVNNYYRFFVMCKDGWNTVRFYGVNYPI